jgi:opacity protein-like surface antigen
MLGAAAAFQKQVTGSGVTLNATNNVGVLASVRWHFSPLVGIELNYGRVANAQTYTAPPYIFRLQNVTGEYSGAAVITPWHREKYEAFVLGGLGALSFYPKTIYVNGISNTLYLPRENKIAVLYGGGVDYKVYPHVALRLQYRGLVYKAQDYKYSRIFTGSTAHVAEPSVGVVLRF